LNLNKPTFIQSNNNQQQKVKMFFVAFWGENTCLAFKQIDLGHAYAFPNKLFFYEGNLFLLIIFNIQISTILGGGCSSMVGKVPEPFQTVRL
jgi:hypothetical protein